STTRSRTSTIGVLETFAISQSDRCKEHGKNAVQHDNHEDGFDDRIRGFFTKRLGAALHLQALDASDDTDDQCHERRFNHADLKRRTRYRFAQTRQENLGLDATVKPGHQTATVQRRHRTKEGQDRHRDHQGEDARQNQYFYRIETHGPQGIDFFAHAHGAELGRIRAARTAGDHDAHDQHADFAQHQHADHIDDIDIGAKFTEMKNALLRENSSDQHRDE